MAKATATPKTRIALRLRTDLWTGLENWRAKRRPLPTVTEAIEEAIADMLRREGIIPKKERIDGASKGVHEQVV